MLNFNLKLKNNSATIDTKSLGENKLKISLKLKGLIHKKKFSSKVNFQIKSSKYKNTITDLVISNINIDSSSSSSYSSEELICMSNVYTLCLLNDNSTNSNNSIERKIYKSIKSFIKSIKVKTNNDQINKINFSIENSKINKLLIKGLIG